MHSGVLDIKMARVAVMILPIQLRQPRLIALATALVTPFASLLVLLAKFRFAKLQELKYNGQTCRLEYCLNYKFGNRDEINDINYARRIRVKDGTTVDGQPYIIYRRNVNAIYDKPKRRGLLKQIILNRRSVNCATFYNFIVECPQEYVSDTEKELELAAVVNTYKTQGKTWELKIIK